jgi:hypothetical protein
MSMIFDDTLVFSVTFFVFTVSVWCLRVFHGPVIETYYLPHA